MLRILTAVVSTAALAAVAVPAAAQRNAWQSSGQTAGQAAGQATGVRQQVGGQPALDTDEKVNQLIVYGDDPCPTSAGNEITVCARKPESERYRIPEPLRGIDQPQSEAWNNKVLAYETVGQFGTNSCSPAGAGGFTGCTQQLIQRAAAERANGTNVRFGELIQQERERRLATIDQTAAEEQARVEVEERAYEERRAREAAGTTMPAPPPQGLQQ